MQHPTDSGGRLEAKAAARRVGDTSPCRRAGVEAKASRREVSIYGSRNVVKPGV